MQGGYHDASQGRLSQIHRPKTRGVQIAIHPRERGSRGKLFARRIERMGKAAVKMPRHEEPFSLRALMRESPVRVAHIGSCWSWLQIFPKRAPRPLPPLQPPMPPPPPSLHPTLT